MARTWAVGSTRSLAVEYAIFVVCSGCAICSSGDRRLVGPGPAETFETKEKRKLLERLLDKLNESERAALVLFEVEGYSGNEIAEIQRVPLNTVWARIHKGRKKLQAHLRRVEKSDLGRLGL